VSIDEVGETGFKLAGAVEVIALNGGVFDGSVHALYPLSSTGQAGRCHDVAGSDAGTTASEWGSWPARHRGSRQAAAACAFERQQQLPLLQSSGLWTSGFSALSGHQKRSTVSSTWPPSSD
jgi:hypothetical protein